MRRWLPIILPLWIAGAVLLVVFGGADDDEGGAARLDREARRTEHVADPAPALRDEAADATLRGAPNARSSRQRASRRTRGWLREAGFRSQPWARSRSFAEGVLVDDRGDPVPGAVVYELGREQRAGARTLLLPSTVTDRDGRFRLGIRGPGHGGAWLGASKEGHAPAFTLQYGAGTSVRLVLASLPSLRVSVATPGGESVEGFGVVASPEGRTGAPPRYPGPDSPVVEVAATTDANGVAVLHLAEDRPVVVRPSPEETRVTDPPEHALRGARGLVAFTVLGGCRLFLDVVESSSGAYVEEGVTVEVLDDVGETREVLKADASADEIEAELGLEPGTYHLEVSARGREPVMVSPLVVVGRGETIRRRVAMTPLQAGGVLELGVGASASLGRAPALITLVRRNGPGWSARGWHAHARRFDAKDSLFRLKLRPGAYDVVVADRDTGKLASAFDLVVQPGTPLRRRVTFRRGAQFALHDVLPPNLQVREIGIEVPGLGRFPPFGRRRLDLFVGRGEEYLRVDAAGSAAREDPKKGPVLGPYPASSVVLHVTDWDGVVHRFTAPR